MVIRQCVAIVILLSASPALAAAPEATCRNFTADQGVAQPLFFGFLYGYTAAKLEGHSDDEINAATHRLAGMVADYCLKQPDERILIAVAKLAGSATIEPTK